MFRAAAFCRFFMAPYMVLAAIHKSSYPVFSSFASNKKFLKKLLKEDIDNKGIIS